MDPGTQERLGFVDLDQRDALHAEDEQFQLTARGTGHFSDDSLGSDGKEVVLFGGVDGGITLRKDQNLLLLSSERSFDRGQRRGPADRKRHQKIRKQDRILQGQKREGLYVVGV